MRNFSSKAALYNVTDVSYSNARETLVRYLFADATRSLVALFARSKTSEDGGNTEYLTTFFLLRQLPLLSLADELGDDDVMSARQGAVADKRPAAADGGDHEVKKRGAFWRTLPHSAPAGWRSRPCL